MEICKESKKCNKQHATSGKDKIDKIDEIDKKDTMHVIHH